MWLLPDSRLAASLAWIVLSAPGLLPEPAPAPQTLEARLARAKEFAVVLDRGRKEGDLPAARRAAKQAVDVLLEAPEARHSAEATDLLFRLGRAAWAMREFETARGACEAACAYRREHLPEDDLRRWEAQQMYASTLQDLGKLDDAIRLQQEVVDHYDRLLPEEDGRRQEARYNLATDWNVNGRSKEAKELFGKVLEARVRTLPADDPDIALTRMSLAISTKNLGDLDSARPLEEQAVAILGAKVGPEDPRTLRARFNLATTLGQVGDLATARFHMEQVLAVRVKTLPPDDTGISRARLSLANIHHSLGDYEASRALGESALAGLERKLGSQHHHVQAARTNLAGTCSQAGDYARARELVEQVLAVYEVVPAPDNQALPAARQLLGHVLEKEGDLAGARKLIERSLAELEKTVGADNWKTGLVRLDLGRLHRLAGEYGRSRELIQQSLTAACRTRPDDDSDILNLLANLARACAMQGDRDGLAASLSRIADATATLIAGTAAAPPRERQGRASSIAVRIDNLLSFAREVRDPKFDARAFALLEDLRTITGPLARGSAAAADPKLAGLLEKAHEARAEIGAIVSGTATAGKPDEEAATTLATRLFERDRLEAELTRELVAHGLRPPPMDVESLRRALPQNAAVASYVGYKQWSVDPAKPAQERFEPRLAVHVVRRDAPLERIDLGPLEPVSQAVERWRDAIGSPLEGRGRGVSPVPAKADDPAAAGEALRKLVLDPVLARIGAAEALYVRPDDVLYTIPFDALPLEKGCVGEKHAIHVESCLANLLRPPPAGDGSGGLVAMGGVDYDAAPDAAKAAPGNETTVPPIQDALALLRGGKSEGGWTPLPQTLAEVQSIGARYRTRFEADPVILEGARASKAGLVKSAPGARFLHVATHGYFAADARKDAEAKSVRFTLESTAQGLAPMALCGLALAGANRGMDSLGRVDGILTAEELAGLDLSRCELAVLSACETNVGIRTAGKGIESLQSALGAAGARTAVTSLWKVDDARTRELFEDFYSRIWTKGEGKAQALWNAKKALRARGAPVRDWAAWVLTGAPE